MPCSRPNAIHAIPAEGCDLDCAPGGGATLSPHLELTGGGALLARDFLRSADDDSLLAAPLAAPARAPGTAAGLMAFGPA
jgi:hypothetical protein